MANPLRVAGTALAVVGLLTACAPSSESSGDVGKGSAPGEAVRVTIDDSVFAPDVIEAAPGEEMTVEVKKRRLDPARLRDREHGSEHGHDRAGADGVRDLYRSERATGIRVYLPRRDGRPHRRRSKRALTHRRRAAETPFRRL